MLRREGRLGYLNVILEEMSGKLNLVLEGHEALDGKIERYHQEAKEDHRLTMDLVKYTHDELKKELQSVDQRSEERDKNLAAEIQVVREKLKGEIQGVRTEMKGET